MMIRGGGAWAPLGDAIESRRYTPALPPSNPDKQMNPTHHNKRTRVPHGSFEPPQGALTRCHAPLPPERQPGHALVHLF